MKGTTTLHIAALLFVCSCSVKNQPEPPAKELTIPSVQTQTATPAPVYELIPIDSNKRTQIECFLVTAYQFQRRPVSFGFGKVTEESLIGQMSAGGDEVYVVGPGPDHWENSKGETIPDPPIDNTNFEVITTDTVQHLQIRSSYVIHGYFYQQPDETTTADQMIEQYRYGSNGKYRIADDARARWQLSIGEGKDKFPFRFTPQGVELPKQFVARFKKSFKL